MSGKRYPEEFKIEAAKQVVERGRSVSSVQHVSTSPPTAFTPEFVYQGLEI